MRDWTQDQDRIRRAEESPWAARIGASVQLQARAVDRLFKPRYGDLAGQARVWPQEEFHDSARGRFQVLHWPGEGPPLFLLHGLNANAWCWARVAMGLSARREVFVLSQRGHGLSVVPGSGYDLEDCAGDLESLWRQRTQSPADLGGESWGGRVAAYFAATRPGLVRRLILADPVLPSGFNPLLRRFPLFVVGAMAQERGRYADQEALWARAGKVVYLPLKDEIDRRSWMERFARTEQGSYVPRLPDEAYAELIARALLPDISQAVAGLRLPILFLKPTFSITFWPGEMRRLLALWPQLQVRRVLGDHTFPSANPLETTAAIEDFLQRS